RSRTSVRMLLPLPAVSKWAASDQKELRKSKGALREAAKGPEPAAGEAPETPSGGGNFQRQSSPNGGEDSRSNSKMSNGRRGSQVSNQSGGSRKSDRPVGFGGGGLGSGFGGVGRPLKKSNSRVAPLEETPTPVKAIVRGMNARSASPSASPSGGSSDRGGPRLSQNSSKDRARRSSYSGGPPGLPPTGQRVSSKVRNVPAPTSGVWNGTLLERGGQRSGRYSLRFNPELRQWLPGRCRSRWVQHHRVL
ncbi:unnamed protein product, partial [Polarella glacialis]